MNPLTLNDMDAVIDGLHQVTNAQLQAIFSLLCDNPRVLKTLIETEVQTRGRREKFDRENGLPVRGQEVKA